MLLICMHDELQKFFMHDELHEEFSDLKIIEICIDNLLNSFFSNNDSIFEQVIQ